MGFGFSGFGFSGFGIGFSIFQIMFSLVFMVVFGMFVVVAVKGVSQWNKSNHALKLTVSATIVAKRTNVAHHHHNHHGTGMTIPLALPPTM